MTPACLLARRAAPPVVLGCVLVGQARLTPTPGRALISFHIPTALEGLERLEDALRALEPDRKQKTNFGRDAVLDISTRELECRQLYFPCGELLNSSCRKAL